MVPYENKLTLLKNKLQNSDPNFKPHFTTQSCSQTGFDSMHDSDKGIGPFQIQAMYSFKVLLNYRKILS